MSEVAMEQAPQASVEERAVDALFGPLKAPKPKQQVEQEPEETAEQPESPEESTEEPLKTAEELFELELDGETFALPKKLEKAVMSSRDYTQKSQKNAELQRQYEILHEQAKVSNYRQAFEAENAEDFQKIQAYDTVLKQPIDWSSLSNDEAFRRKIQIDQWKTERDEIARTLSAKHQQWTQKQEQALTELRQKADEAITKRIPNWNAEKWNAIREHAKSDGYTEAELKDIIDPRHKVTLWKAQQFDELKAKATKTVTDVKTVITKPSNPMPQQVKDKLNFRNALKKAAPGSAAQKQIIEQRIGSIFSKR